MERTPVKSSAVASVGFEDGVMEVEYAGGRVYRYRGVPQETFDSLMAQESIGKAIRASVVAGGFEVEKVEQEPESPVEWDA